MEWIWVSWTEVDEPGACYKEWSKSKRERQILYINTYIYMESRKVVLMNLFAGKEWKNRRRQQTMDTVGEGDGGTN